MDAANTKRIVLLGKTGAGKSSLANTMLGEEVFTVGHTFSSETKKCEAKTGSVNGREITVVDTPGFFDTDRPEEELKPEIVRCITECSPGPHAFLIVLKAERFTQHEMAVIAKIHEYFSEDVFRYSSVVFTHGAQLPEKMKIENFVSKNKCLSDLVEKCGGRCHVIDSKYWKQNPANNYRSNRFQVEQLLKTIDKIVQKNKERCYTNKMLQTVEEEIQKEDETIRQSSRNMSEEEIRKQAKANVSNMLMIKLAGVTTGALMGAFFGVVVMVGVVYTILQKFAQSATLQQVLLKTTGIKLGTAAAAGASAAGAGAAEAAGATAAGAGTAGIIFTGVAVTAGAVSGGVIGYAAADGAKTPLEAAKKAAQGVTDEAINIIKQTRDVCDKLSQLMPKQDEEK